MNLLSVVTGIGNGRRGAAEEESNDHLMIDQPNIA
jgi:hypothetical protein